MSSNFTLDTQIRKLPYRITHQLSQLLDIPGRGSWEELINVLPDDMYSFHEIQMLKILPSRGKSPSEELIKDFARQLMTVRRLISFLERMDHQEALLLLRPHERVQITQEPSSAAAQEGNSVSFECQATGFPRPEYQWYFNNRILESETDCNLMFTSVRMENAGEYQCRATNPMGSEFSNTVTLQVMPKPGAQVVRQPNSANILELEPFELSCGVEGGSDLTFQWIKDGYPIPEANSPSLRFPAVQQRDGGNYSCKITGPMTDIITHMANLTVTAVPERRECPSLKLALLIGNENYKVPTSDDAKLVHPEDDVFTLKKTLFSMGFKVVSYVNLDLLQLEKAIAGFCQLLRQFPGAYGFFYFGGHGFEINGKTYLVPCDAPKKWTPETSVCAENILSTMQDSYTKLDVLILDVCRVAVDADDGLAMKLFDPPFRPGSQSIFAYATCPQSQAFERRKDANGIYVKHLAQFLSSDERIDDVIRKTNEEVHRETESQPVTQSMHPTSRSSLTRRFSLKDPAVYNEQLDREAASLWLQYQKLPSNTTLSCDHGITVMVRFYPLFTNSAFVMIQVPDLGDAVWCDATLYKPPEGIEAPLNKMNQQRNPFDRDVVHRGTPFKLPQESGIERCSRLDAFEKMPESFVMAIQVEYRLVDGKEGTLHKSIRFNRDEFGVSKFFWDNV